MNKKYIGSKILSELNDLKRTLKTASEELGINQKTLNKAIKGDLPINELNEIINQICKYYPINKDEFSFEEINPIDRFIHFKSEDALLTSRVYKRKNSDQEYSDYYEYRDSATTRLSKFRPEWIRELRVVKNNDPRNKNIAYNNGHFMHQLTFFVGPVNFYYAFNGEYFCEEMNTGDSNYIPPFIPHSFASRSGKKEAYIIAVTFGGNLKNILPKISMLNNKLIDYINNLIKNRANIIGSKNLINSLKNFDNFKYEKLSQEKSYKDSSGVLIKKVKDYKLIKSGIYKAASSENYFSGARGFHIKSKTNETIILTNPCDSFLFNYGDENVILENLTMKKVILFKKGDSVFVNSGDEYKIIVESSCSIFLVTLDLYLTPSIIDEIISFSNHERLYEENKQWFN